MPVLSARAAMRNPISPLAIIAVPRIAAGYKERDFAIEAVACGGVGVRELSSCSGTFCECLSRPPSVARGILALGKAFDSELSVEFLVPVLQLCAEFVKFKQLHRGTVKHLADILIVVVIEGIAMRMRHIPVISFPISINTENTMPRQTTAPLNMRVTGIEKPMEA